MAFKLADREVVLATHAEHATGPGWTNDWLNVLVFNADGQKIREIGLQWFEMTDEIRHLFKVCAAANKEMLGAVLRLANKDGK
jgi:hypothetical protein